MSSSGVQYLIINALETLDLLIWKIYDEEKGFWYIKTPSYCRVRQGGIFSHIVDRLA
jgi:hypothetical protein